MSYELLTGDCRDVLPTLAADSVDCVVTSPPYAEQRKGFYDGVPEADYPAFTVAWLAALRPALRERGSVLVNIREHVRDGQISDYVHRTRLAVRAAGWYETDELIWIKPAAPPVGHPSRPRRSWERILWFSPARQPWCDPKANGHPSRYVSINPPKPHENMAGWLAGSTVRHRDGIARGPDYVEVFNSQVRDYSGNTAAHPAAYPPALAAWCLRLVCPPGGTVCDPFSGSASTGVAALAEGRRYVGIEQSPEYVAIARRRLDAVRPTLDTAQEEIHA